MKKEDQMLIQNKGEEIVQSIGDIEARIQATLSASEDLSQMEFLNLKEANSNLEFALGNVVHALNLLKNI